MTPAARPHVVVHVAISLDGATTGFTPDVGRFYALARTWREDVTLAGADTILAQEHALRAAPRPGPAADGPLLAVVDSGARVREWNALRDVGHWSGVLALRASRSPTREDAVAELVTGSERVDLAAALAALARERAARTVRVDSGGGLVGALLAADLLDEVSLLVHPLLVGTRGHRVWHGGAEVTTRALELVGNEVVEGGLVWLRYRR
jgi:2,5-diamino-6-(ribosylamino)-4(3H)-pyrimidinone 5'-phosphate reductase